jgi:hypothetical protein
MGLLNIYILHVKNWIIVICASKIAETAIYLNVSYPDNVCRSVVASKHFIDQ